MGYAKQNCVDSSTPGFDIEVWSQLVGGASKGRMYGVGRSYISGDHSVASVGTPFMGEPAQVVDEAKMEEYRKKDEERDRQLEEYRKKCEETDKELEKYRKKDEERDKQFDEMREEARKIKEDGQKQIEEIQRNMQEIIQKMIQEAGLPNHKYPGGSGHGK